MVIIIFDGFDNLDAIGPFEVFNHARSFGADINVGLYTLTSQEVVRSSHGLRIKPDGVLRKVGDDQSHSANRTDRPVDAPDIVVVPGGGWKDKSEVGTWREAERGSIPEEISRLYDRGSTIASVCTGGMLLARAGLISDRPAVTHHDALEDLSDSGAEVVETRVVDAGDIITAGGIMSGIDLALHLVRREVSAAIAERVAAQLEYEPRGTVHQA